MKLRTCGLLAIAALVFCFLASAQVLAQNAYITNNGSNTVSVIDTATNTVTATIPVGSYPYGVAVSPNGSKVYVTNGGSNNVSVIDTSENSVIATIPVGNDPHGVAVSPDGSKVYVGGSDGVAVIATASNTVIATIPVGGGLGVAVSPDGSKVYVITNESADGGVAVIATASNTVTAIIPVGGFPQSLAVSPDGSKVYVATFYYSDNGDYSDNGPGSVAVIDTASNTVIATIIPPFVPSGNYLEGVAVSPDGSKVYFTEYAHNRVGVIDTASNTVIATIPVNGIFYGVAVSPDGSKVYVANFSADSVAVIATASNTVIATIHVGNGPIAFGVFIQPAPTFAGTPGSPNCHGQSVSALAQQYGGLAAAARALGYSSVQVLQNAIADYCAA